MTETHWTVMPISLIYNNLAWLRVAKQQKTVIFSFTQATLDSRVKLLFQKCQMAISG